jgi:hypothetical protein
MKGDFTRMTFNRDKRFSRVLMQQGRVQLDADWNEQGDILLHYLRTLAADLIGPHGGPADSFAIEGLTDDDGEAIRHNFSIGQGHYYVDGILCENDQDVTFQSEPNTEPPYPSQPDYPFAQKVDLAEGDHLIYLDVWERHISYLEDEDEHGDEPSIREVALGGPDTATRAKVVWQIKAWYMTQDRRALLAEMGIDLDCISLHERWQDVVNLWWQPAVRGRLKAWAKVPEDTGEIDPCTIPPEARYRGPENQLYRVEIHDGGPAGEATFKYSRENGSVVYPIEKIQDKQITVQNLGRDDRFGLQVGDWVEVVDDDYVLQGRAEPLCQVKAIDPDELAVIVEPAPSAATADPAKHPLLRRWDHRAAPVTPGGLQLAGDGAARVVSDEGNTVWHLEQGIHIQLTRADASTFRSGDYWLIPARTASGDLEWPGTVEDPGELPPHGIEHHYAPLAIINVNVSGEITNITECRRTFPALAQPV